MKTDRIDPAPGRVSLAGACRNDVVPATEGTGLVVQACQCKGEQALMGVDADRWVGGASEAVQAKVKQFGDAHGCAAGLFPAIRHKRAVAVRMATKLRVFMVDEPAAGMSTAEPPKVLRRIDDPRGDRFRCVRAHCKPGAAWQVARPRW